MIFEPRQQTLYAVLLHGGVKGAFLAHSTHALPAAFHYRHDAVTYRKELKQHGLTGRVIKIDVTIRPHDPERKSLSV